MTSARPNVVFLFSDQHNADFLGCEGHPDVATPNLDRLGNEGTSLSRAYCQDAICAPSRCSLFSGLYPRTLGLLDNGAPTRVAREAVSLPSAFRNAGYRTAAFGKRHLSGGCDEGWDIAQSHMFAESPGEDYVSWIEAQGLGMAFASDWSAEFGCGPKGGAWHDTELPFAILGTRESHLPDDKTAEAFTAQRTVEFLRECAQTGEPFFCFSSFYRPHQPYTPLASYWSRHDRSRWGNGTNRGDAISRPETLAEPYESLPPLLRSQFEGENRVWRQDLARADEQYYRDYVSAYCALVEEIDVHVGTIVAELAALGMQDNTILVYTSDHGDFVGAHGMVEKCAMGHNVYEDTLRVPLMFRVPDGATQQRRDELVELVDLYPTLLDLCSVDRPDTEFGLQGRSLASALAGGPVDSPRECIVTENWTQATVVTDRHKLGVWIDPGPGYGADYRGQMSDLLFDREEDPYELHNLIHTDGASDTETALRAKLNDWIATIPDDGRREAIEQRGAQAE